MIDDLREKKKYRELKAQVKDPKNMEAEVWRKKCMCMKKGLVVSQWYGTDKIRKEKKSWICDFLTP